MPSPPGRFSITIGWSHFLVSRSASNRAPISAPLPGPSVRMNLTDRVGHDCAATGPAANSGVNNAASINVQVRRRALTIGSSDRRRLVGKVLRRKCDKSLRQLIIDHLRSEATMLPTLGFPCSLSMIETVARGQLLDAKADSWTAAL